MISSIAISWSLSFQLQEDMNHSWVEKSMGVAQYEVENAYFYTGLYLAAPIAIAFFISIFYSYDSITAAIQAASICISAPILFHSIMFQIEPKKPIIQILCSVLIVLFIGTAIFAHPLSALIIPVVIYYGRQHQTDQYYNY